MKSTKKWISVLLSVALLVMSFSAGFSAMAAATGVSEEQWNTLITALKNENVASVSYAGTDGNYTLGDPDGSVLAAMDAFTAVLSGLIDLDTNDPASTARTIDQLRDTIKTELNTRMNPTDFLTYNVDAVISVFTANAPEVDKAEFDAAPGEVAVTVTVHATDESLLAYDSLTDLPEQVPIGTTFTFRHTSHSHSVTSGCSTTTTYFLALAAPEKTEGQTIARADLLAYEEVFAENADLINEEMSALVDRGTDGIAELFGTVNAAYSGALAAFSRTVFDHFFASYQIPAIVEQLDTAASICSYLPIAEQINTLCESDYENVSAEDLEALYAEVGALVANYNAAPLAARQYIEENGFYDPAAVEETYAHIWYLVETNRVTDYKALVDADLAAYADYNEDTLFADAIASAEIDLAIGNLQGRYEGMSQFTQTVVVEVCGPDYMTALQTRISELQYLLTVADYDAQFADRYAYFTESVFVDTNLDDSSADLLAAVANYDAWYSELKVFVADVRAAVGDETADRIMTNLEAEMQTYLDSKYNVLCVRLETEVDTALALYDDIHTIYGDVVNFVSLATYAKLDAALGQVETDIYDFLAQSENFEISEELAEKYASFLVVPIEDYHAFRESGGFDRYAQSYMEDIVRHVEPGELARDQDYIVTDEKAEQAIDLLDTFLTSDEFAAITGADLSGTITGLLDGLYTNDLVNTVVQYLYPLVANEFVSIWATLPSSIEMIGVETGESLLPTADVFCELHLMSVEEALKTLGFYLFPATLADAVAEDYPQVADVLRQANAPATSDNNPWEDPSILDENGKLALDWGVTDRESFLDAASAALRGVEPLLLTLLAGQELNITAAVGTGDGTLKGKALGLLDIEGTITIDPIEIVLTATANSGYNNALAPILEALGLTAPDGDAIDNTRDLLDQGLLTPIENLLAKLADAPLDTVLRVLPNIAYALSANLVMPLLGMLKTDISYSANAQYLAVVDALGSEIEVPGTLNGVYKSEEPIAINVGDMIDLSSMGIDLSGFDGFMDTINGLLGVNLPTMDYSTLATLGELTWKDTVRTEKTYNYGEDGKAAFIEANRADVLLFVLDYVIGAMAADENLINEIAGAFGASTPVTLPAGVDQIIANVTENGDNAIAAVCEAMMPMDHSDPPTDINWLPASDGSVTYSDSWTRSQAEYVAENLPSFIDNILKMVGVKIGGVKAENLPMLVELGIGQLYTADTINALAAALAKGFAGGANLGAFGDMLIDQIGLDCNYWVDYHVDFADGDKDAFVAAMVDVLSPFDFIMGAILNDEDLALSVTDETGAVKILRVNGYDGYSNGIIPLFEALGAEGVLTPAEFAADREHLVENLVRPLLTVLDRAAADPYAAVADLIPNLLYFIASDGLSVAIRNIGHAAFIALDTIAPVYDLNLEGMIGFDLRFTDGDPIALLAGLASSAIYESTGIDLDFDFTTDSLLDDLCFGELVSFTSANGKTAYRMDASTASSADILTAVLRFLVSEIAHEGNAEKIAQLAKDQFGLSEEVYAFLYSFLNIFEGMIVNSTTDDVLGLIFWVFYGADNAVDASVEYYEYMYCDWAELIDLMARSDISYIQKAGMLMRNVYATTFMPLFDQLADAKDLPIDSTEILGFIDIFHGIMDVFRTILDFFEKLFTKLF